MERFFVSDEQEAPDSFALERHGPKRFLAEIRRGDNSDVWMPVRDIEEVTGRTPATGQFYQPDPSDEHERPSKKRFASKTYELIFPIIIVFCLGSFAIAMSRYLKNNMPQNTNRAVPPAMAPGAPMLPKPDAVTGTGKISTVAASRSDINHVPATIQNAPASHDAPVEEADYYRTNWSKFMTLTPNNYKRLLLGGIKGLAITFTNDSPFPVDEVIAEICYIKANRQPWKTKQIALRNIPPHSSKKREIVRVRRSRLVHIRIKKITASSIDLNYETHQ